MRLAPSAGVNDAQHYDAKLRDTMVWVNEPSTRLASQTSRSSKLCLQVEELRFGLRNTRLKAFIFCYFFLSFLDTPDAGCEGCFV